jgi:hypothetical protein
MIADTNSIVAFGYNSITGIFGGDVLLLGILLLLCVSAIFVVARVKASSALMIGAFMVFIFSIVVGQLFFVFWLIIIASLFILINGLRKQITGQ